MKFFSRFFKSKNEKEILKLKPIVNNINNLEREIQNFPDKNISGRIKFIKKEIFNKIKKKNFNINLYNKILNYYLEEVFALVREASKRVLNMRHFDVQILGGIVLHYGKISEMQTGEGKTLVATLPAVLNSLTLKNVHIITVNEYLASRDAEWMGRIYGFLGLSVSVIFSSMNDIMKKKAYSCNIVYGQNNEFGFDYLRDNMKLSLSECVQSDYFFSIVDEVDSILIDEARTPLIISGKIEEETSKYILANNIVRKLKKNIDFTIDEKAKTVILTEKGIALGENLLKIDNLYSAGNMEILHYINQALKAYYLFNKNIDYVKRNDEIMIVDEHTGRIMKDRRWSDGIHQAIEVKENCSIQSENQTLATITFQNFFRMYKKLSGMTGTASTESEEFSKIYNLDVIKIPTNKPLIRTDADDNIYMTEEEKISAICSCVLNSYNLGQPILIGTVSIEKSELLSFALKKLKVKHEVLNAKHHMNEAYIIAQAGQLKSVTIATNMAGRGTDIILGGDSEFMARNEVSKKINQKNSILVKFGFLTGNPKLIDINALARKDFDNINYLINMKESTEIKKKILKNSLKYNKKISLNNLMHFDSNTKSEFFESRISFYKNSVNSYSKALIKFNKICEFNREKVLKVGGLKVIGTERHESRRIDNQLRGRAGRQGDPGETCFYLSLEDDLMRIFGSKKMFNLMHKFGIKKNIPIKHPWISKSIENAQKRVEGFNFDSRKELIEYDDVINKQRSTIYTLRNKILFEKNISELILDLIEDYIINLTSNIMNNKKLNFKIKYEQLEKKIFKFLNIEIKLNKFNGDLNDLMDYFFVIIKNKYFDKKKNADKELILKFEKMIYLESVDENWKTHLQNMDYLREGIHFRGYAQKDPRQEYKKEGYILFSRMRAKIRNEVISKIFKAKIDNEIQKRINEYFIEFEKFKKMNNLNHNLEIEKIEKANEKNFSKKKKSSEKIIKFNREQRRKIVSKNKKKKKNICV